MSDWNPGSKYQTLLNRITEILENGEKRTVRDVYYALESRGHGYEYRKVLRAVKKGRRAGFINPSLIIDPGRPATVQPTQGYSSVDEFLSERVEEVEQQYIENYWNEQPEYIEVWLEKQSLASVFDPICNEWNVRLECTRGDWSDSKVYQAAQRLVGALSEGKDITILYFGDYNPSGYHTPVAIQETMQHYGVPIREEIADEGERAQRQYYFEIAPSWYPVEYEGGGTLTFDRIAMNTDHVDRFDLPENPTPSNSSKDKTLRERFKKHVTGGRDVNIELNALKEFHRDFLEDLVQDAIKKHVDVDAKERVENRIGNRRDEIHSKVTITNRP